MSKLYLTSSVHPYKISSSTSFCKDHTGLMESDFTYSVGHDADKRRLVVVVFLTTMDHLLLHHHQGRFLRLLKNSKGANIVDS
ncbi:hypothetical protein Leryth_009704 [Lithospermum erythrorhizon]|nr:hypothetical protein Leryth_009704 [Lithospermum erythrorhizon]